jgi:hypothetical protein
VRGFRTLASASRRGLTLKPIRRTTCKFPHTRGQASSARKRAATRPRNFPFKPEQRSRGMPSSMSQSSRAHLGGAKRLECGDLSSHLERCREVEGPGSRARGAIWDRDILLLVSWIRTHCPASGPQSTYSIPSPVGAPEARASTIHEIPTVLRLHRRQHSPPPSAGSPIARLRLTNLGTDKAKRGI